MGVNLNRFEGEKGLFEEVIMSKAQNGDNEP
jgi:hypothetical protein